MEANGRLQGSNNKSLWPECPIEAFRHLKPTKTSSTPAVVSGAALALAKARVGGYYITIVIVDISQLIRKIPLKSQVGSTPHIWSPSRAGPPGGAPTLPRPRGRFEGPGGGGAALLRRWRGWEGSWGLMGLLVIFGRTSWEYDIFGRVDDLMVIFWSDESQITMEKYENYGHFWMKSRLNKGLMMI